MTKQHVLIMILIVGFVLAFSKFGRADSIICDDLVFTETSDVEVQLINQISRIMFRGTVPVKSIKNISPGGARINLHTGSEIYFNQMTQCMSIEDEVDSIKNLRWFLKKSADARISNWKHKR
ncbi:hypothetical protein LCGC14_1827880 [marine sediment metagenome]|uniref:Uncharacterized protein n=1 Tax=marine sediment metagenome TaxID=412755 RepID=A0A0F9IWI5_9ZZZZ